MAEQNVQRYKLKVCLLGNESVGKSSLIRKFVTDQFSDDYIPTLGTKITKKELVLEQDGLVYDLVLLVHDINGHWSTMGQTIEDFKNMMPSNYYSNAEGLLIVCDLTRKDTFLDYDFWYENITKAMGKEVPCMFLGNKADLVEGRKVSDDDIAELKKEKNSPFLFTSAKTGANVEEAFKQLGELIIKRIQPV